MIFEIALSETIPGITKTRAGFCVKVRKDSNDKEPLEFMVGSILPRSQSSDIRSPFQFELLTKYLDFKGKEFQSKLYDTYKKVKTELEEHAEAILSPNDKLPFHTFNKIMDMFDVNDIRAFLKDVYKLNIPDVLLDTFDEQMQLDEEGTRGQTYLKSDYLDLAATVVIIKASYILLGHYAFLTEGLWKDKQPVYVLFEFYKKNLTFMESPAVIKLQEFIEKLIHKPDSTIEDKWKRNIFMRKSNVEIIESILTLVIFHKLSLTPIVEDTNDNYTVSSLFKFVTYRLDTDNNSSVRIKDKTYAMSENTDTGVQEKESFFEGFRYGTDFTQGEIAKVNWCVETFERILPQLSEQQLELINKPIKVMKDNKLHDFTYIDFYNVLRQSKGYIYSDLSLIILQSCFKGMMDPRLINRVEADGMLRLLALGLAYIWNLGMPKIAVLMSSIPKAKQGDVLTVNISTGKSRIPQEVTDKLVELFPLFKSTGKNPTDGEHTIKKDIEDFTDMFYENIWQPTLPIELLNSIGLDGGEMVVPEDLRVQFAKFIIENESICYRPLKHLEKSKK